MSESAAAWAAWRQYVKSILFAGRVLTDEERQQAQEMVRQAKAAERREKRKAKRLAAGREWAE